MTQSEMEGSEIQSPRPLRLSEPLARDPPASPERTPGSRWRAGGGQAKSKVQRLMTTE
jgi:hypothetical protein